jgi:hypothetical protein
VRAVNDLDNDSGKRVADCGTMYWVRDIRIGIDQDLIWLLTFSGLLTENRLTTSPEAADLVAADVVSKITLTS